MSEFGELKYINIRSVWPHEAHNFTPWLAQNIQKLGEVLGIDLEVVEEEASVGDFSLDLLAKDLGNGRNVIIENQFGNSDHDHFGKLLTYAAGFDASAIIWIAEYVREEHRSALEWLNQRTNTETHFFAVTLEIFRIDDSKPVFRFKPIVLPNEWQKVTKQRTTGNTLSSKGEAYRVYFQHLLNDLREKHKFTGAKIAQAQNWYNFASGISGVVFSHSFSRNGKAVASLYIDQGDEQLNKKMFDWLYNHKDKIEVQYGEKLTWERLDNRQASSISLYTPGSIHATQSELEAIRAWTITHLLRLKQVFVPWLRQYKQGTSVLTGAG